MCKLFIAKKQYIIYAADAKRPGLNLLVLIYLSSIIGPRRGGIKYVLKKVKKVLTKKDK